MNGLKDNMNKMKLFTDNQLFSFLLRSIEGFHSRNQELWKCMETKEGVYIRKEFTSYRSSRDTNMAVVSLFRDTNRAAITSSGNIQ